MLSAPSVFLNFPLLFVLCSSVCVLPLCALLNIIDRFDRHGERRREEELSGEEIKCSSCCSDEKIVYVCLLSFDFALIFSGTFESKHI